LVLDEQQQRINELVAKRAEADEKKKQVVYSACQACTYLSFLLFIVA